MSSINDNVLQEFNLIDLIKTNRSKGRIIWLFNIGTEKYWNEKEYSIKDTAEEIVINHIEEMNLLLTRKQDVLVLRKVPDKKFLNKLEKLGFEIPQIVCPNNRKDEITPISELVNNDDEILELLASFDDENTIFVPYGVSYLEDNICKKTGLKRNGASENVIKLINDKMYARNVAEKLGFEVTRGYSCFSIDELEEKYHKLCCCFNKIIIKQCFGASGKGLYIVENDKELAKVLRILKHFSKDEKEKKWLIEGWYDKKTDLNYQIYVGKDGIVNVFSIKEQLLDETVYMGSLIPPRISDDMNQKIKSAGEKVGQELYKCGFFGVLGVDAFITSDNKLIPIIEINARFTLSTYISFLNERFVNKKILAFYERINLLKNDSYGEIENMLDDLLYYKENGKGILVYVSETLQDNNEKHKGRLFAASIADTYDEAFDLKEEVIKRLKETGRKNGK